MRSFAVRPRRHTPMSKPMVIHLMRAMVFLALAASIAAPCATAQSTTNGAIQISVTDPQGLPVPQATISSVNSGTGQESHATTNDQGQARFVELQPGSYKVTITASGFDSGMQQEVVVEVGRVTALSIPLQVGGGKEVVNVSSAAPLVSTAQSDFSNNVNQKFIAELPINGRRWSSIALSTPGAVPDGTFGLVSFRGISGLLNNNTVDGGDNNQAFFSEERGRTRISYVISMASIQEFQVNTSNYSAEFGRAAGGVVNAVTKSGSNNLHGDGFYYIRDNKWGATNPFTTVPALVNGVPTSLRVKPTDRRQQFGGAIGGPIKKDKLFFFFSYDEQKRNFPGVATPSISTFFNPIAVGPPAAPKTCASPGLTTGQTLSCRAVTQAQADAGMNYLQALTGTVPRTGDQYLFFPKVDWQFSDHHRLTAEYNHLTWNSPAGIQTQPAVNFGKFSFGNDFVRADSLIARLSSALSPTTTNEIRFQWGRDFEYENRQAPGANEFVTGPGGTAPEIQIQSPGFFQVGKPDFLDRRAYPDERRKQIADTFSRLAGNHLVKFGGDFNHVSDLLDNLFQESGVYKYGTLAAFLTDFSQPAGCRFAPRPPAPPAAVPVPCYSSFAQGFGPTSFHFATDDIGLFFQDDWHATRRLTLNLGLRWEYERLPRPQVPNPLFPATAKFPSNKNNFGPRVGFAWDVFGNGKTSLRGGYGIYYGRIINSTISNAITNTGSPSSQISSFYVPNNAGAPTFPNTLTSGKVGTTAIVYFDPNAKLPLVHETDLTLERDLGWNTMLSVSFLGSRGTRLPNFIDQNLNPPSSTITYSVIGGSLDGRQFTLPLFTGARPNKNFAQITQISTVVNTYYAALVLQLNRRLATGLEFRNNYTWSHSTDTGQNSQTFTSSNAVFNPFDLSFEHGNSNFDIRHRFVSSLVWTPDVFKSRGGMARKIFNGYTISPIILLSQGAPYTPNVSSNAPVPTTAGGIIGAGGTTRFPFLARNSFHIRSTKNVDLRLSRNFHVTENSIVEVLADAFNIFNHENFTTVNPTLYSAGGTATAPTLTFVRSFGAPSGENSPSLRERQIQLGVRFHF